VAIGFSSWEKGAAAMQRKRRTAGENEAIVHYVSLASFFVGRGGRVSL
jgi:hypothetical protein